jgi:hypothetical protein
MLEIGQQQLLIMLLVIDAELQNRGKLGREDVPAAQRFDALLDVAPVFQDCRQSGARYQTACRARVLVADGVVMAVEEHAEIAMERAEHRFEPFEREYLEKPRGVREAPLDRARVGHRLKRAVFLREAVDEPERLRTRFAKCREQRRG